MEHIGNKLGDDKYRFEIMEHSCNRSIAENPEKEGDFMQDGFLHCGTCKEPKREMYEWHGFVCLILPSLIRAIFFLLVDFGIGNIASMTAPIAPSRCALSLLV